MSNISSLSSFTALSVKVSDLSVLENIASNFSCHTHPVDRELFLDMCHVDDSNSPLLIEILGVEASSEMGHAVLNSSSVSFS